MSVYATGAHFVGDKFVLKALEKGSKWDLLISTETYDAKRRLIVEKMKLGLDPNKAIGLLFTPIAADFTEQGRLITVGIDGPLYAIPIKDIGANVQITGASNRITELFNGDATAQQVIEALNLPIDSMVSVTELTGPTTLTRVYTTPTTGEYYVDLDTGLITIGGTSVSGTNNYRAIYDINSGRIKELVEEKTEDLTTVSHVGTATEPVSEVISVKDEGGVGYIILYSGTPLTGQVVVNLTAGTFTFLAGDAVATATVRYKTGLVSLGKTLQKQVAGEPVAVEFHGVH
jgi:hypothetical protein